MITSTFSKIDKVKALVLQSGGWQAVYASYPDLRDALERGGRQVPCPKTGDGKTKFRFFKDVNTTGGAYHNDIGALSDGIEVISWYSQVSTSQALDEIIRVLGGDLRGINEKAVTKAKATLEKSQFLSEKEVERRKATIKKYWDGSRPIAGTLAETYLRNRGIKADLSNLGYNLRFHPSMPYWDEVSESWLRFPCMLAVVRNAEGKPLTLHRTFIAHDGSGRAKLRGEKVKKMMLAPPAPVQGGFILIDKPMETPWGKVIGLSEGIETGLSVREATGAPIIVGISDRIMEMVNLPSDIDHIFVWEDVEPSGAGERAGKNIQEKWEAKGKKVHRYKPMLANEKSDWNDVYLTSGQEGFPFVMPEGMRVETGVPINICLH